MSTIVIKLKKSNYLAIVLFIVMILWQGYGLYQSKIIGVNLNTYISTKVISNVIPGAIVTPPQKQESLLNKFVYGSTEIDLGNYRTFIERNIPLLKNQVVIGSSEEYNTLKGFKAKTAKVDEDYFDPSDELFITNVQQPIELGKTVTKEQLQQDSFVTSKLINFEANLNHKGQAMKQVDTMAFIEKRFSIDTSTKGPKILIFHTHPHERFADEEPGGGGVVDVGAYLTKILETQYGVETMHCTSRFEATAENAKKDDYGRMQIEIKKILAANPSIEVTIDIHRDGIGSDKKFLTTINGKQTAQLMFVNGFTQVQKNGVLTPIKSLPNPYVADNMAIALQMQLKAMEKYPGFMRKTLVKPYRYSLHMKPKAFLLEVGNQNNEKQEALNTMEIFAELLMDVIEKD